MRCRWSTPVAWSTPSVSAWPWAVRSRSPAASPGRTTSIRTWPRTSRPRSPMSPSPTTAPWRSRWRTAPSSPSRSSGLTWRRTPARTPTSGVPTAVSRAPATPWWTTTAPACRWWRSSPAPSRAPVPGRLRSPPPTYAPCATSSGPWASPRRVWSAATCAPMSTSPCASRPTRRWAPAPRPRTSTPSVGSSRSSATRSSVRPPSWPPGERCFRRPVTARPTAPPVPVASSPTPTTTATSPSRTWFRWRPAVNGSRRSVRGCPRCPRPSAVASRPSGA